LSSACSVNVDDFGKRKTTIIGFSCGSIDGRLCAGSATEHQG
jgi:hypothetical protein